MFDDLCNKEDKEHASDEKPYNIETGLKAASSVVLPLLGGVAGGSIIARNRPGSVIGITFLLTTGAGLGAGLFAMEHQIKIKKDQATTDENNFVPRP